MSAQDMYWEYEFQSRLDEDSKRRAAAHGQALEAAAAEHARIREVAEAVRLQAELEEELEKQRQIAKEQERVDQIRREVREAEFKAQQDAARRAEQERRDRQKLQEAEARREEERRRAELAAAEEQSRRRREQEKRDAEARQQQEAAAERAAQAQRQREANEKAKKEAALEAVQAAQRAKALQDGNTSAPIQSSLANGTSSGAATSNMDDKAKTHARYLEIHKNMKELRKWLAEQAKQPANQKLKAAMGDGRREIRKFMGQLTGDSRKNMQVRERILQVLLGAASFQQPTADITKFLFDPPPSSPQTQVPALLLYEMNIFIKALMGQFVGESAIKASMSNPLGILGSAVFANADLRWQNRPLIDMLLAKFHVACPLLFGIYGPETTDAGKRLVGWKINKDYTGKSGSFVPQLEHSDRMTGFGAGFAALTLRNYDRSSLENPLPAWHFWRAVATITNTPSEAIQPSHALVLRAMMQDNERRIVDLFADLGVLLLKYALVYFPAKAPRDQPVVQRLTLLADQLAKDKKLYLKD